MEIKSIDDEEKLKGFSTEIEQANKEKGTGSFPVEIDFIEIGKGTLYGGGDEGIFQTSITISNS